MIAGVFPRQPEYAFVAPGRIPSEGCAADRGSVVAVAVRRMHMDGIDTDVIAVADAKAGGNDRPGFILDEVQMVSFRWRGTSKETTMRCITFVVLFKSKEAVNPFRRDKAADGHGNGRILWQSSPDPLS